jgi:hypothetical protein
MNCDSLGLVVLVAKAPATQAAPPDAGAPAGPNMLSQMVMPRDAPKVNGDVYLPTRGIKTGGNVSMPFRADPCQRLTHHGAIVVVTPAK